MTSDREKLESETLGQLADRMQDGPDSTRRYFAPLAELERRKASWMKDSADAQIDAAEATKETARYTKRATLYMLLSVIAVLLAAIIGPILTWYFAASR